MHLTNVSNGWTSIFSSISKWIGLYSIVALRRTWNWRMEGCMTSLKHCENLLRCQLLTSSVRRAVNHILGSSIWRCVQSISIPKWRLTHWINPLPLSTLSLWIYMCNKKLVSRKRIVCPSGKGTCWKVSWKKQAQVLHNRVKETNTWPFG